MKRIILITSNGCAPCRMLKYELSTRDIPFEEYDESTEEAEILYEKHDICGAPCIILKEQTPLRIIVETIEGYSETIKQQIVDWWIG